MAPAFSEATPNPSKSALLSLSVLQCRHVSLGATDYESEGRRFESCRARPSFPCKWQGLPFSVASSRGPTLGPRVRDRAAPAPHVADLPRGPAPQAGRNDPSKTGTDLVAANDTGCAFFGPSQIGRASCRERV